MRRAALALTAVLLAGCGAAPAAAPARSGPAAQAAGRLGERLGLTARSVQQAAGRLVLAGAPGLSPAGPLGPLGPLGAYGPLGTLGPVGSNAWNPARFMGAIGGWDGWSRQLTAIGGPLSAQGPLGPDGPLGAGYGLLAASGGAAAHLAAGGAWSVLGPAGPLGALGPLGPLGPVGAHGFKRDGLGRYVDATGAEQRTVTAAGRRYELFEQYPGDSAAQRTDNDTSFMAEGAIDQGREADRYALTSAEAQYVTFLVVPEKQLDDFDLEVRDGAGAVLFRSNTGGPAGGLMDFVQLRAAAGERLEARVTRGVHLHAARATYRLIVVGATDRIPASALRGPHLVAAGR